MRQPQSMSPCADPFGITSITFVRISLCHAIAPDYVVLGGRTFCPYHQWNFVHSLENTSSLFVFGQNTERHHFWGFLLLLFCISVFGNTCGPDGIHQRLAGNGQAHASVEETYSLPVASVEYPPKHSVPSPYFSKKKKKKKKDWNLCDR